MMSRIREAHAHRPSPGGGAVVLLWVMAAVWLSTSGCLTGMVAMDVATKMENRSKKRALLDCRAAGPVGHIVGSELPGRDLPADVFLRTCSTKGEELVPMVADKETLESLGKSIRYHWARDHRRVFVEHVVLADVDRRADDPSLDVGPLVRDFARPERYWIGELETAFLIAGGVVLLRDSGILRSERDHPFGWLRGADVESFWPLGRRYARDAGGVWYLDQRVEGADIASFQPIAHNFARDRSSVFYAAAKIPGASPGSFRVLNHGEAEDGETKYRIELSTSGWELYCGETVCHQHERRRTLPGQQIVWSDNDRRGYRLGY